jgi:hypothetical protein
MILRFLNWQGIAGIAASIALATLLVVQKIETGHWRKQSATFEQLYRGEQAVLAGTVANYRAAADAARAADRANLARVTAEQRSINERTSNDYQARLAAARSLAQRLRVASQAAAHPGPGGSTPMPAVPATSGSAAQGSGEDRLPRSDRLIATEQGIQLDELIKWLRSQAKVDNDAGAVANPPNQ